MIDHIFIFSENSGNEADELVQLGFEESPGRVHIGQGTINRKFIFDNFFLEILWINNKEELDSEKIIDCGLHKRAYFQKNGSSRFGLCLKNNEKSDTIFVDSYKYQPDYFEKGCTIGIYKTVGNSNFPWIFRLPFREKEKKGSSGLKNLSKVIFEYEGTKNDREILNTLNLIKEIEFLETGKNWLTLVFDEGKEGFSKDIESLNLTLIY